MNLIRNMKLLKFIKQKRYGELRYELNGRHDYMYVSHYIFNLLEKQKKGNRT